MWQVLVGGLTEIHVVKTMVQEILNSVDDELPGV